MSTPQKAPLSISTIYRPKAGTVPIMAVSKIRNWILVTGDERLRKFATKNGVQVHGFIWALQQCNLSEEKIKQILNQIASGENMRRIPLNIFLNVFFPNK